MNASVKQQVDRALECGTREELVTALGSRREPRAVVDVARLTRRLRELSSGPAAAVPVRIHLVRTYTTELLKPYWPLETLLLGLEATITEAPYGVLDEAAGADFASSDADLNLVFCRIEDLDPELTGVISAMTQDRRHAAAERALARLEVILQSARAACRGLIVVTLLPRMHGPEIGQFDLLTEQSDTIFRQSLKHRIAAALRERHASVLLDDLDELVSEHGRATLFDDRLWLMSRFPWSAAGAQFLVRRLARYAAMVKQPRAKVIALDADNTLWGGILGEDGPDGIALGPDYPGSAFVAFQRRLLEFQQRGILLVLCSKNNPDDVRHVLHDHPHMLLREGAFAAQRVNWQPKVDNLKSLAEELNLGLDSFICVDDSPHECFQVSHELPQVKVVPVPEPPTEIPSCLDSLPSLEILNLTDEDRARTQMFAREQQRKQSAEASNDVGQYLKSLQMVMTVSFGDRRHVARIAQLTQKTNQFNVTTRRYHESDVERMIVDEDWLVADFSLSDSFGDSGIVGVSLVKGLSGKRAEVDIFLMSCRVIGRGAESAFLRTILEACARRGVKYVSARFIPTAKNELVKDFWPRHGFVGSGEAYEVDLARWTPIPTDAIRVEFGGPQCSSASPGTATIARGN